MQRRGARDDVRTDGFTLLEILLALVLLALVVSMISVSLSGSMRVIDATEEQGNLYYRARIAMQRISSDLASARLTDDVEFVGSRKDVDGARGDSMRFASMAHVIFDPEHQSPGMGVISYEVEPDRKNSGELVLLRSDLLYRPGMELKEDEPAPDRFLLCDRLRSVRFTFIDSKGEEHESWDTRPGGDVADRERRLPAAVSCTLEFWLDREQETSLSFSTSMPLPAGMIYAEQAAADTQ